jgi:hypothetical protein
MVAIDARSSTPLGWIWNSRLERLAENAAMPRKSWSPDTIQMATRGEPLA